MAADGLEIFLRDELASWSATYMYQPSGNASGRGGERVQCERENAKQTGEYESSRRSRRRERKKDGSRGIEM